MVEFKSFPDEEPHYDHVNYLVIIKHLNAYSYAFRYYNGESFDKEFEGEQLIGFTETDPKEIAKSFPLYPVN